MTKFHKLFLLSSALILIVSIVFFINVYSNTENKNQAEAADGVSTEVNEANDNNDRDDVQRNQTEERSLGGYGWSSNIGWISFNGSNYKVSIDEPGNLSGYGWSSNIGWLKFGGLSGFPSGFGTIPENVRLTEDSFTGWARFCAGMNDQGTPPPNQTTPNNSCAGNARTDGWNGWLSLKGSNYGVSVTGNPGPEEGSHYLSGYSWGSNVVGWVDMSGVYLTSNAQNIQPNPVRVEARASAGCFVEITWALNTDPGRTPEGTTFNIYSFKDNKVVVTGLSSEVRSYLDTNTVPKGQYQYYVRAIYNRVSVDSGPTNTVVVDGRCIPMAPPPQINSFRAVPPSVPPGQSCVLTWAGIRNIDLSKPGNECAITGPGMNYLLNSVSDGSISTPSINATSRYTLTCKSSAGQATAMATCSLRPTIKEI